MEIDEDNHLPMATREAILSLYEELQNENKNESKNSWSSFGEDGWGVANLHHLLQLIEAIRRDTCYLQLTMGQAASLVTFEACRVFSNLAPDDSALRKKLSPVIENHFDEVS